MTPKKNILIYIIAILALATITAMQVNLVYKFERNNETAFNEKARLILARTTESLTKDTLLMRKDIVMDSTNLKTTIDSLINYYMNYYGFQSDYSFEVLEKETENSALESSSMYVSNSNNHIPCYEHSLSNNFKNNSLYLKIYFPSKKNIVFKDLILPIVCTVLLTLVILLVFIKTINALNKEKKIAEHTKDFLDNMVHEFKTPLSSISLASKLILKNAKIQSEPPVLENLKIILEENEKLKSQVDETLSITSFENGLYKVFKEEVDLHLIVENCIKLLKLQIESKQITINYNFNVNQFVIMADKLHLTNCIKNLLDNAIKYSDSGREIMIELGNEAKFIFITIKDNGVGIDKVYHQKVFDKYFRVPTGNIQNVKGFGIGLTYVKKIIDLHDGKILLESELNVGTTIKIYLPYE